MQSKKKCTMVSDIRYQDEHNKGVNVFFCESTVSQLGLCYEDFILKISLIAIYGGNTR